MALINIARAGEKPVIVQGPALPMAVYEELPPSVKAFAESMEKFVIAERDSFWKQVEQAFKGQA